MTSKFSGTVAGFNDILQILVNISAASHFYFLRNTRLSTICSWWFTALELLKLLHNFLLRDSSFCYEATRWFPVKNVLGTGISSSSSAVKVDAENLNLIFPLLCFSRKSWTHGWVAYKCRGFTGGFWSFYRDAFPTPSTVPCAHAFQIISLFFYSCTLSQGPLVITDLITSSNFLKDEFCLKKAKHLVFLVQVCLDPTGISTG